MEYEINGKEINYFTALVEANSLEEALEIAHNAVSEGSVMWGDSEIITNVNAEFMDAGELSGGFEGVKND
jgi:hypothetical protein